MGLKATLVLLLVAGGSVAPPPHGEDPTLRPDARAVLMIGIDGDALDPGTLFHLRDGGRGVVLFGGNIETAAQIRDLARQVGCATGGGYLLAVDHEPGRVQRLAGLIGSYPATSQPDAMEAAARQLGEALAGLGVTVNLAPVIDLTGPSPALAGRTLGEDPATVVALGEAFRRGVESARVAAVVKHFPGHGRAFGDPHRAVSRVDGPSAAALAPFQLAVMAGARAVMVGHPVYSGLDPELPASSSPAAYTLLRSWGFEGVAVTDALGMRGARAGRTVPETAVAALSAGADLVMVEDPAQREAVVDAVVVAVESGSLSRARLSEAARRVRLLAAWTSTGTADCGGSWPRR